uniref:DBR1 domain-containing protein n=2 Tax=Panagrellus redivivus TaxID=6233 RepID=A0A7E4ZS08_PANRE
MPRLIPSLSQVIVDNGSEEMEEEEEPIIYDDLFDPVYLPVNVAPQRDGPRIERCFAGPTDTLYKFDLPLTPVPAGVNYQNYNTYMDCRPMTRVKPNPKYDDKPLLEDNIIPHVVPSGEDEMEPNQPDEPEESEESEGSEESEESEPQEIPPGGPRLERFSSDDEVEIKSGSSVASDEAHRQDDFKDDANGDSDKENVENMEM